MSSPSSRVSTPRAAAHGRWAYGGIGALQRVDPAALPNASAGAELRATNRYASVLVARRLGHGLSIGANAYYAGLQALQGLGALYAGSDSIALDGKMSDVRLGMVKGWSAGRSLEVIVLHNRTDIAHDVRLFDVMWDPSLRTTVRVPRLEHNEDRGRTWGAHSKLVTRLAGPDSTRVGLLLTANRLTHPKIPNYRFSNLPRDPGTTYAFNIGAGIGQSTRRASFGFDVIYEPMFSHTWAEAGPGATTADGTPIPADTRTIENHFRFSNVKVAFGLGREFLGADTTTAVGFQFGLAVDRTTYRLRQEDNLTQSARRQRVGFTEWGPTLGIHWHGPRLRIGYSLALTCSPGACAIGQGDDVTVAGPEPGVIASPTANLGFDYGRSLVQKFTFSVPIRR